MVRHQSFSIKTMCISGVGDTGQGNKIRAVKYAALCALV